MIGRQQELSQIEEMVKSRGFRFLIMYGRRRVGKTTILSEIARKNKCIFFSAQEKNDSLNLEDFSRQIQNHFDGTFISPFNSWENALSYISSKADDSKRTIIIIDELPFIAKQNPGIKSIFQHEIDHKWKDMNIMLVLCGSSVSFMVNDVMGYESPLYGRCTGSMEIESFDYFDSAMFFPKYSREQQVMAYGILGGIPRYLLEFDDKDDIVRNIRDKIVYNGSFLNDEPNTMLRLELREISVYGSMLQAIANGYNRVTEISDHTHEEATKVSKYLNTLRTLRVIEKIVPCGEKEDSKKAIYSLKDNYFSFWYRFIYSNRSYYEMLGDDEAAAEISESINEYMGHAFEKICKEYIIRLAKMRKLPFVPFKLGRWWGNNPAIKAQDDVDILAINKKGDEAIFCECKFTNRPMPMEEYDDLVTATLAFPDIKKKHIMFISKSGFTNPVLERAKKEGVRLISIEDLFDFS